MRTLNTSILWLMGGKISTLSLPSNGDPLPILMAKYLNSVLGIFLDKEGLFVSRWTFVTF